MAELPHFRAPWALDSAQLGDWAPLGPTAGLGVELDDPFGQLLRIVFAFRSV